MKLNERIEVMFNPRSVAIVGASRTIGKWGFTFLQHLTVGGYTGAIYPVNPAGGDLMGHQVYRGLKDIPGPVDLAFIVLPPEKVAGAITECGEIGVPACVVITAGFKEVGPEGLKLEQEVALAADRAGLAMVGPNCAGISSPYPMSLHCMMQSSFPPAGKIAVISQSGNLAGSLMYMLAKQDIGISRCVSVGNQARLGVEDFLEYLITDEATQVAAIYLEGAPDGERFMDVASRLTRVKPLLVIKGGRTETGGRAARSHTGAIAGSDVVFEGMCRQCGIIRVNDLEELADTATAFLSQPAPAGRRVGIVANGGGWGVLTADACIAAGLDVAVLSEDLLKTLDKRLPPWWNRQNPIDMVAGMSRGAFFKVIEALCQSDEVDSVIALGFGYGQPNVKAMDFVSENEVPGVREYIEAALFSDMRGKNFILELIQNHRKPVLLISEYGLGAEKDENQAVLDLRKKNILLYPSSRRAAEVLARLTRYGQYLRSA